MRDALTRVVEAALVRLRYAVFDHDDDLLELP